MNQASMPHPLRKGNAAWMLQPCNREKQVNRSKAHTKQILLLNRKKNKINFNIFSKYYLICGSTTGFSNSSSSSCCTSSGASRISVDLSLSHSRKNSCFTREADLDIGSALFALRNRIIH